MRQPLYADWNALPFRVYLAAQRILQEKYRPEEGQETVAQIELLALLYGLSEDDMDTIAAEEVPAMWRAVAAFMVQPPIIEELAEFEWEGIRYRIDRDPRDISLRQLKIIEEYRLQYPDDFDLRLVHCALLISPVASGAYGRPATAAPFSADRAHQWRMVADWPTPICYSLHAFFLRHWLNSKVLTPLSMVLQLMESQPDTAALPAESKPATRASKGSSGKSRKATPKQ